MDTSSDGRPSPSILIVDDERDSLNLLCGIVKEGGYRARPVSGGEFALRAAAASPPDLIILDITMPDMSGFEVCERLKADPALSDIPVIFISGMADIADKLKGYSLGGVDYITKPFQFEEVVARVATHLELRRQRRELQENYDRLRELETLRDSLVHMLVHDLRSPLTALTAYLGILNRKAAPGLAPEQRADIEQALNAAKRMVLMVNSVLDVNKLEAAKMTLRTGECDVVALAREVLDSLGSLAESRVMSLRPEGDEFRASLDRGLIFRVIQNLVANALKFAPANDGLIAIGIGRAEDGVRINVTDNGPGIPIEHHGRIFEKFGQAGEKEAREVFSTGLGLSFCKLAVEAHGGRIGVESEVGKGSTFWFVLPGCLRPLAREEQTGQET